MLKYINDKVCTVKYSDMLQYIYTIFSESFLIYVKVTTTIKLKNQ